MLDDPIGIIATLLVIEGAILFLAEHPRTKGWFKYAPSMFWIYFLPMLAGNVGLIASGSPVYGVIRGYCLPACLVLLLLSADVKAIFRLGAPALAVMLAGSLGIVLGGPAVYLLARPWLDVEAWKGFGALSASWIGGSANMIAVASGTKTPEHVFSPMVVVDTICPYAWMGLLVFFSAYQRQYDRWNRSRGQLVEELSRRAAVAGQRQHPVSQAYLVVMLALGAAVTMLSLRLAALLPGVAGAIDAVAWSIILATGIGVALSFTPARRLEGHGASRLGYALLYLVLASIGAKTNVTHLGSVPILLLAGMLWILIHAGFTVLAGRLLRVPMAVLAMASQANIGGTASTPVVAEVYQPGAAPVGLLLAIFGGIIGTYLGLACSWLCGAVSRW